ncbi:cytidine/deoxycytidylate deaminase family protein [Candidatus Haliotispira prima]|uniref:Cytidine/deoxycytidylate deaminase family protein n=1 Tax=Candidatus Haliotispira prima TaxID=3034016 RepID=A0ABY8MDS6_9SPIO|nr:cytidine/deoxycytidylate deaminase family protein [Candidatus Haliotispira prima]
MDNEIKVQKKGETGIQRPSWDDYFFEVCEAISGRATCDRGRSGCVIVKDKQILATGYVGAPAGLPHCDEVGHLLKRVTHEDGSVSSHCMRTVHAEQNAICQAAKFGLVLNGATVYCTMTPCRSCAMMIINIGIRRVVVGKRYSRGRESEEMFAAVNIELLYRNEEEMEY